MDASLFGLTVHATSQPCPIYTLSEENYTQWLQTQTRFVQTWLKAIDFKPRAGAIGYLPQLKEAEGSDAATRLAGVCVGMGSEQTAWMAVGRLPYLLPEGIYHFDATWAQHGQDKLMLAWGLGAYRFTRYKQRGKPGSDQVHRRPALCFFEEGDVFSDTVVQLAATYRVRDLINTPTQDLGPSELAEQVAGYAEAYQAHFRQIVGEDLLHQGYHGVHTVGRASDDPPRLLEMTWGQEGHPSITLVGKGVCFDTGGLDLKTPSGMLTMKKDMGGAAHVLGLAHMIITHALPVHLRVLVCAVENAVGSRAYRPGDVITMRNGLHVEVGNTDAEGRLIVGDALVYACEQSPDLLIDFTTLTGAARVALGMEVAAAFTSDTQMAKQLQSAADAVQDPLWMLPLYTPYQSLLESPIADTNNVANTPWGGAITAALFLQKFVDAQVPWVHFDVGAWNEKASPGRPKGGEATGLRAAYAFLKVWLSKNNG